MGQKSWQATQFIVRVFNPPGSTVVFRSPSISALCFFRWIQLCKIPFDFGSECSKFSSRVSHPFGWGFLFIYLFFNLPIASLNMQQQTAWVFLLVSISFRPILADLLSLPLPRRLIWVIKPSVMYATLRLQFVVAHLPPQATLRDFNICHIVFLQEKPCPWPPQTKSCWDSAQKAVHPPKVSILFTKVSEHSTFSQ